MVCGRIVGGVNASCKHEILDAVVIGKSEEEHVKGKPTGSVCGPQADSLKAVRLDGFPRTEQVLYPAPNAESAFRYFAPR